MLKKKKRINMNSNHFESYWRANKRLIAILLIIWGLVSLAAGILFVEPLNAIRIGGLPLGFWMAQQGSIFVFVILIFFYAWCMDRLDHKYKLDMENNNSNQATSEQDAGKS